MSAHKSPSKPARQSLQSISCKLSSLGALLQSYDMNLPIRGTEAWGLGAMLSELSIAVWAHEKSLKKKKVHIKGKRKTKGRKL